MAYGPWRKLDMKSDLITGLYAMKALKEAGGDQRPIKSLTPATRSPAMSTPPAPSFTWTSARGDGRPSILRSAIPYDGIVVERKGSANPTVEGWRGAAHAGNSPEKYSQRHPGMAPQDHRAPGPSMI